MSASNLNNGYDDSSFSKWYICPETGAYAPNEFANEDIPAGAPLLVGSSSGKTRINFLDPSNSSTIMKTIDISDPGEVKETALPKNCTRLVIYCGEDNGATTVSIAVRNDTQKSIPGSSDKAPTLLTYTSSVSSPGLTGSAYYLVVGGGGGGNGGAYKYLGVDYFGAGSGGGTGGIQSGFISDISVITAITVGSAGAGGGWTASGGSGGASTISRNVGGAITSNGGQGGQAVSNNQPSTGGTAGTPGGVAGSAGAIAYGPSSNNTNEWNYTPPPNTLATQNSKNWFQHTISAGGSGIAGTTLAYTSGTVQAAIPNIISPAYDRSNVANLGRSSSTFNTSGNIIYWNNGTGYGFGGHGGNMSGYNGGSNGIPGGPGVVYLLTY